MLTLANGFEQSVMNVVDGGRATVERLTVTGAQSDDFGGAFYFGRGHGGGRFENVAFVACLAERAGGARTSVNAVKRWLLTALLSECVWDGMMGWVRRRQFVGCGCRAGM